MEPPGLPIPDDRRNWRHSLLRRPFFPAAVLFILGIMAHRIAPDSPGVYLGVGAAALLAGVILNRHDWPTRAALAVGFLLAGLGSAQLHFHHYPGDHIVHFTRSQRMLARVRIRIVEPPRTISSPRPGRADARRQVTQGDVQRILTRSGWQPASGRILLRLDQPIGSLRAGQEIEAFGELYRPAPAMNEGEFDWAAYYRDQRILAGFSVGYAGNVRLLRDDGPGPLHWLRAQVREALRRGFADDSIDHALLRALVLGDPDPQLRDVQDDFLATGTSHHLAISGMHVAILGGFILLACRAVMLRPRLACAVAIAIVVIYGSVALPSPPVLRSVFLCGIAAIGILCRRHIDYLHLLGASVLGVLACGPLDLYRPGFQLSFGTVLGLMLMTRPTLRFIDSFRNVHDVVAESFQPRTFWRDARRRIRNWLREAAVASTVAFVVAAPLVLYHFNQLNPWAVAASLLLAIPVIVALVGGFLKILLSAALPFAAVGFAWIAALPIATMRWMVAKLALLPGSSVPLPRPPIWSIGIFYACLLLPLLPWPAGRRRWLIRLTPALGALLLLLSILLHTDPPDITRLTVLSVGAGQCAVLETADGRVALFDAGSISDDIARRVVLPYLKSRGIARIDWIILSHANTDHFNAVQEIAARTRPQAVYVTPQFISQARFHADAAELLSALRSTGVEIIEVTGGQSLKLGSHAHLEFLWPPRSASASLNDSSLVARLECAGRSILFTGDLQDAGLRGLPRTELLRCDVLLAPHHGSFESSTPAFLKNTSPRLVIASDDSTQTGKQARFDRAAGQTPLLRSHSHGMVQLHLHPDGRASAATFGGLRLALDAAPAAPRP